MSIQVGGTVVVDNSRNLVNANASGVSAIPMGNASGTLAVGNGGTGNTAFTAGSVLVGNGTSAVNIVSPGTNGNVLVSNGTTWISQAASAGGSSVSLTAAGAVYAGNVVALNSNSTISQIAGASLSYAAPLPASFATGYYFGYGIPNLAQDTTNQKVAVGLQQNVYYYTSLATVSGTTITMSTLAQPNAGGGPTQYAQHTFLEQSNKVIAFFNYYNAGQTLYAAVGTQSGTSLSYDSQFSVHSTSIGDAIVAGYDAGTGYSLVSWFQNGAPTSVQIKAVSRSGTTNYQSTTQVADYGGGSRPKAIGYDSTNSKSVLLAANGTGAGYIYPITTGGTATSPTVSIGSGTQLTTASLSGNGVVVHVPEISNPVLIYQDSDNSSYVTARPLTYSTSTGGYNLGSKTVVVSASARPDAKYATTGKRIIATIDQSPTPSIVTLITSSTGTFTVSTALSLESPYSSKGLQGVGWLSGVTKAVIGLTDYAPSPTNAYLQYTRLVEPGFTTADNWLGIASTTASSGNTATVQLMGAINTNVTGLTAGTVYYVADSASGGTNLTSTVQGSTLRKLGKAITSTSIYITQGNA
jgi:hypothetical protein